MQNMKILLNKKYLKISITLNRARRPERHLEQKAIVVGPLQGVKPSSVQVFNIDPNPRLKEPPFREMLANCQHRPIARWEWMTRIMNPNPKISCFVESKILTNKIFHTVPKSNISKTLHEGRSPTSFWSNTYPWPDMLGISPKARVWRRENCRGKR